MDLTSVMLEPITDVIANNGGVIIGAVALILGFTLTVRMIRRFVK